MDLQYVDKLAKDNNGVECLLVRQDLFDRTVDATGRKTRVSKETVGAFVTMIKNYNPPKKIGMAREQNLVESSKKLCKIEGIQIYSTKGEAKAAFSERTKRSLKNILYFYMEDYGYRNFHKLSQFGTTLKPRINCSMDLIPKNDKISDFAFILYSRPLRKCKKNLSLRLEIEFASPSVTYPSGGLISYSLLGRFLKLLQFLPENLQHTQ